VTKTNSVPIAVLGVMGVLFIYVVIVTAKYTLTVYTFDAVGYFDLKMAPILVTRKIVNTRITASAFTINQVQIPYYQNRFVYMLVRFSLFTSFLSAVLKNTLQKYDSLVSFIAHSIVT
jgi:hypothetical protein